MPLVLLFYIGVLPPGSRMVRAARFDMCADVAEEAKYRKSECQTIVLGNLADLLE